MKKLEALSRIATDLTGILDTEDRYTRLLEALRAAIPYDAATLLRIEGDTLVPLAGKGLRAEALEKVYKQEDHPRFMIICASAEPVFFAHDCDLPDPFDGMLNVDETLVQDIHACMGCPLYVRERLVGVLAFDALDPHAFAHLPPQYVQVVSSLAGAHLQTVDLFARLEKEAERQGQIAHDLMHDIRRLRGKKIIGTSQVMKDLRREISLVADSDLTVLVQGESGVGKELVVRAIHESSPRNTQPFLYLNCAALPESLAEAELFGHVQGAFTGANTHRAGKFELADQGTLFLDEIGELPLGIQAKLLRTIQEGEVQRIGSEQMLHVNIRLLVATNRNLEEEVRAGRFRADLFHRLNVYPLSVPPLRERKEDIADLADFFASKNQVRLGSQQVRVSQEAKQLLRRYSWPGNVRELENIISRSVLKASRTGRGTWTDGSEIQVQPQHLSADFGSEMYTNPVTTDGKERASLLTQGLSLRDEVKAFQIRLIRAALANNGGNWAAAGRDLNMNRSNLHNLATRLGMRKKKEDSAAAT